VNRKPNVHHHLKHVQCLQKIFGEPVTYLASITDPATLDLSAALMDRVHDVADALLTMRGHLAEQHRYISGLSFDVRLVLCMWLMDTDLAAKLVRVVYAKA
jgi:hypothetical protein